jgi:hypothetical protein
LQRRVLLDPRKREVAANNTGNRCEEEETATKAEKPGDTQDERHNRERLGSVLRH